MSNLQITPAQAAAELAALQAQVRPMGGGDRAMERLGPTALRQHQRRTESEMRAHIALAERITVAERRLAESQRLVTEAARVRLTEGDLSGAVAVRTRHGWHRVVRVSSKSVTVATPYTWTDRLSLDKILEVRMPT